MNEPKSSPSALDGPLTRDEVMESIDDALDVFEGNGNDPAAFTEAQLDDIQAALGAAAAFLKEKRSA